MTAVSVSGPLRVGLLTPGWPGHRTPNGIATAVSHLRVGLEAAGCKVTIVALQADGPLDGADVVLVRDASPTLANRLRARLDPFGEMHKSIGKRIAAATNEAIRLYDIEILVMEETFGWVGIVQGLVPIPVVATLHGPWCLHKRVQSAGDSNLSLRREAAEKAALSRVRGITSPSLDALDKTRIAYGFPDVPQTVIRNPMPLPEQGANPHDNEAAHDRLLFVGRFDYHKGGDIVIEAFSRLADMHPGCRLTFVGPDRGVDYPDGRTLGLEAALGQLLPRVRDRIDVRGACSREKIMALRQSHAITIVASRYETFGFTIAEAMAAGSALVCTAVGGSPEIIIDGKTGLLVPPDDATALAKACLRLLQDPALAARIGAAARRHIGAVLEPGMIGGQMAAFLRPICRP